MSKQVRAINQSINARLACLVHLPWTLTIASNLVAVPLLKFSLPRVEGMLFRFKKILWVVKEQEFLGGVSIMWHRWYCSLTWTRLCKRLCSFFSSFKAIIWRCNGINFWWWVRLSRKLRRARMIWSRYAEMSDNSTMPKPEKFQLTDSKLENPKFCSMKPFPYGFCLVFCVAVARNLQQWIGARERGRASTALPDCPDDGQSFGRGWPSSQRIFLWLLPLSQREHSDHYSGKIGGD